MHICNHTMFLLFPFSIALPPCHLPSSVDSCLLLTINFCLYKCFITVYPTFFKLSSDPHTIIFLVQSPPPPINTHMHTHLHKDAYTSTHIHTYIFFNLCLLDSRKKHSVFHFLSLIGSS